MASDMCTKRLRVLLIPFFATSHIGPFTDFAFHLSAAMPGAVESTVAVTPANVSVVRSALARRGYDTSAVRVATYPFPAVDGLPPGVENLSAATAADAWRIDAAAMNETLMRPAQESLIRELSPDAVVTDIHFFWNTGVASDIGVPCVTFHVIGAFSTLAMRHLVGAVKNDTQVVTVPGFPGPDIRIPWTDLPEFLRIQQKLDHTTINRPYSAQDSCFGLAVHTFFDLEPEYSQMYVRNGYEKRAYFVGPLSPPLLSAGDSPCVAWLGSKPSRSVVYVCFGSLTNVSDAQLRELALGLEAAGKPFLWVVRADKWVPPEGWEERVGDKGMVVRGWAPQTAILAHPAVGAFVTQCGWNSVLEAVAAGVPVLTWPMVFEQFITERLVTEVLGIGDQLWPEGAGVRSTRNDEKEVVPAEAVARAVAKFMEPGGAGDVARSRVKELAVKAREAVAEGGSSRHDLRRLIDDLMEARAAAAGTKSELHGNKFYGTGPLSLPRRGPASISVHLPLPLIQRLGGASSTTHPPG